MAVECQQLHNFSNRRLSLLSSPLPILSSYWVLLRRGRNYVFHTLQKAKLLGNKVIPRSAQDSILKNQMYLPQLDAIAQVCNPAGSRGRRIAASSTPAWLTTQHIRTRGSTGLGPGKKIKSRKPSSVRTHSHSSGVWAWLWCHAFSTKHIRLSPPSSRH